MRGNGQDGPAPRVKDCSCCLSLRTATIAGNSCHSLALSVNKKGRILGALQKSICVFPTLRNPIRSPLLLSAVVGSCLLLAAIAWRRAESEFMAEYWRQRLVAAEPASAELESCVLRLQQLGEVGTNILVVCAISADNHAGVAARDALASQLRAWEKLSPELAQPRRASLAATLATKLGGSEAGSSLAAGREFAADLATRLLASDGVGGDVSSATVANCQQVLALVGQVRPPEVFHPVQPHPADTQLALSLGESHTIETLSQFPGGGIAFETLPTPGRAADTQLAMARDAAGNQAGQPRAVDTSATPQPLNVPLDARPLLAAGESAKSYAAADRMSVRLATPEHASSLPRNDAANVAGVVQASTSESVEGAIVNNTSEQALLAAMNNADPAVRRALAESLPGMRGVDVRQWLLVLSDDPDATVRRTAITWMATSGDPRMLNRVRMAARSDPDESIRQQASRVR